MSNASIAQIELEPPSERLAYSPEEAAKLVGVGRTTIYQAIKDRSLRSLTVGRRRLITRLAIQDWLTENERKAF